MPVINFNGADKVVLNNVSADRTYIGSELVWEEIKRLVADVKFLNQDILSTYKFIVFDEVVLMEKDIYPQMIESLYINNKWVDVYLDSLTFYGSRLRYKAGGNLSSNTGLDFLSKDNVIKVRCQPLNFDTPYKKAILTLASRKILSSRENTFSFDEKSIAKLGIRNDDIKQIVYGDKLIDIIYQGSDQDAYRSYANYRTSNGDSFNSLTGYNYEIYGANVTIFYKP